MFDELDDDLKEMIDTEGAAIADAEIMAKELTWIDKSKNLIECRERPKMIVIIYTNNKGEYDEIYCINKHISWRNCKSGCIYPSCLNFSGANEKIRTIRGNLDIPLTDSLPLHLDYTISESESELLIKCSNGFEINARKDIIHNLCPLNKDETTNLPCRERILTCYANSRSNNDKSPTP